MKVERDKFIPVVITLETQDEINVMLDILGADGTDHGGPMDHLYHELKEFGTIDA